MKGIALDFLLWPTRWCVKETSEDVLHECLGYHVVGGPCLDVCIYVCVCGWMCRIVVEDTYVKSLSKLQKSVQHIPENSLG